MNKTYDITRFNNIDYKSYGLTISLKQNTNEYEDYPDSLMYSNQNHINNDHQVKNKIDKRTDQVVRYFRLGINKWMINLLQTKNITRPIYMNQTPVIHYTIELMNKYERRNLVSNKKGGIGICPLHFHGIIFVKSAIVDRFSRYVGDDKLLDFSGRFISTRIDELNTCYDIDCWHQYINKSNDSYYYAFSDFYPIKYKENPSGYFAV